MINEADNVNENYVQVFYLNDYEDDDRFGFEQSAHSPLAAHHPPTKSSSISPTTNPAPPRTNPFPEVILLCSQFDISFPFPAVKATWQPPLPSTNLPTPTYFPGPDKSHF